MVGQRHRRKGKRMIQVFNNFMPTTFQNYLEDTIISDEFPLLLNKDSVGYGNKDAVFADKNSIDLPQFIHVFYFNNKTCSDYWHSVLPMIYEIQNVTGKNLIIDRCKLNVNTHSYKNKENSYHVPHIDYLPDAAKDKITAVYYVNDSDGDVLFFETPERHDNTSELKIIGRESPKKGKLIVFDATTIHAGSSPIKTDYRYVINFNFKVVK
jgi:2OG-Fe(II) oxygenase superfamily